MATITGRIGYAVTNNLFYAKGGYAGVNNHLSVVDVNPNPSTGSGSQTQWHNGWTVGAGWEYGLTQNWIVGLELTIRLSSQALSARWRGPGVYTFDAKPRDIQSAVVRFNYKLGGPGYAAY
jgi:outer membrane immunogenic protein